MKKICTEDKIKRAALELFKERGIRKSSMNDVAARCGITRMTVYRYFDGKEELLKALLIDIVAVFDISGIDKSGGLDGIFSTVGSALERLKGVPVFKILGETKMLYPGLYSEIAERLRETQDRLFEGVTDIAAKQGVLRDNLDMETVKIILIDFIVRIPENPAVVKGEKSILEIFNTINTILRYGLFKEKKDE